MGIQEKNALYYRSVPFITSETLGKFIRNERKKQNLRQCDLALVCDTGTRFIVDLENGKESCHIGKALLVLHALGIKIDLMDYSSHNHLSDSTNIAV